MVEGAREAIKNGASIKGWIEKVKEKRLRRKEREGKE